jgi:ribosomal RNA assembly protein
MVSLSKGYFLPGIKVATLLNNSPFLVLMEKFAYEIRVPKERVAIIIGKKGEVKRALQGNAGVTMTVDSEEGIITLEGEDSIQLYAAREVIKAIARGFNPDVAQLLLRQDYVLETVNLTEYANSKDSISRLKGRVIGASGKGRENLERLTECFISVYGKTVCIVGELQYATIAKRAVEKLVAGAMHTTVWKYLEKMRRQMKQNEIPNAPGF